MKIWDRHFLRFAGAEPPRQMRKEQRLAHDAYSAGVAYEKPLDSPDRPSNMDRAALERVMNGLPDADNPSKIAAPAFRPPIPEGEELTVVKDGPDTPSTIAAKAASAAPSPPPPAPSAVDLPAESRPPQELPSEMRPSPQAQAQAPEVTSGRIISGTA